VEGGGTTFCCAIAEDSPDNIVEQAVFDTADPTTTTAKVKEWLLARQFDAIGVASFGPIDAKVGSPTYGYITSTPKPHWGNTDLVGLLGLRSEISVPFKFDTDVNAPALAEYDLHCRAALKSSSAYITVGTGIGVGLVVNGQSVKGLLHPEAGHIQVKRHPTDAFAGTCPFHGDCVEGMCSTGALAARAGIPATDLPTLPDDSEVWDHCAYYIAQLCVTLVLIASPELICIGGGVLNRASLYPRIRAYVLALLRGYVVHESLTEENIDTFIRPSHWGSKAGLVGAVYLAKLAAEESI